MLPPANEAWGKAMFLLASVILSTGGVGLCMMSLPVWLPGPMFLRGGGFLSLVPCSFQGVSVSGPMFLDRDSPDRNPRTETPLDRDPHPLDRDPLGQRLPLYSKERTVHILLECILVDINIKNICEILRSRNKNIRIQFSTTQPTLFVRPRKRNLVHIYLWTVIDTKKSKTWWNLAHVGRTRSGWSRISQTGRQTQRWGHKRITLVQ